MWRFAPHFWGEGGTPFPLPPWAPLDALRPLAPSGNIFGKIVFGKKKFGGIPPPSLPPSLPPSSKATRITFSNEHWAAYGVAPTATPGGLRVCEIKKLGTFLGGWDSLPLPLGHPLAAGGLSGLFGENFSLNNFWHKFCLWGDPPLPPHFSAKIFQNVVKWLKDMAIRGEVGSHPVFRLQSACKFS